MLRRDTRGWIQGLCAALLGVAFVLSASPGSAETLQQVMKRRGLTQENLLAAAKTYTPTGERDEFIAFASGGQSGHVIAYGIPSMRILKYIGVFTPEPWQGYGFEEESKVILNQGRINGRDITWGDTHHPALSETNGDYDGEFLFINDKANPRLAVIDLKDFETKQIIVNPVFQSEHGGAFVSGNTEWLMEPAQYAAPLGGEYAPLELFNEKYRGGLTYWKFNREKGKLEPENSFAIELPPYSQDLSDFGKGPSEGFAFVNSFCSERYVGGIMRDRPPFEAGCSAKDTDYLHVVDWKKAAQVAAAGKVKMINGFPVIMLETTVKEGLVHLIPEPKSPHGIDVSPDGEYMVVSGKLDTHTTVFKWSKIKALIDAKEYASTDPYGLPILDMKKAMHTQVQLGLGPLHTQYDSVKGVAYTSLYVDSMVARWNYVEGKLLSKIPIHYNFGHVMTMHGDTVKPRGKYLVSLNKLAIDRFNPVGPLHPQNHQLIDISEDKMQLLMDMPLPLGEPHYVVAIEAGLIKPKIRYKSGTNTRTDEISEHKTRAGEERIVKDGNKVEVWGTLIRSHITPEIIEVDEGNEVVVHLTNLERAQDQTHGFTIGKYNVHGSFEPGETATVKMVADTPGVFPYYCTEFCSALHLEMQGYLLVKPKGYQAKVGELMAKDEYVKADYDKQVATNVETQAVIDEVVGFITTHNYKDFPEVVALVEDATDQLNRAGEAKKRAEEEAAKETWNSATLWAGQWWQYQVKAADIGLRAKTYLEQHGAKKLE
ncbi:MAG: Sec-dependent nitrous-oxide reductase [bacterium]|nr:Sec-dependent nitrous-oxide reductase [bacterium]